MPTDYQLWATQHELADAQLVQVLEFQHPAWGSIFLCDYGADFTGTTEAAVQFTATAVSFTIDLPASTPTTQQEMTIKLDALGGAVMQQVRDLTDAQRAVPIKVIYRPYLDRDPGAPCLDPASFVILNFSATRLVTQLECAATVLPNIAAGIRYTIDEFPSLAYL